MLRSISATLFSLQKNIVIVLFIYLAYLIFLLAVPEFASFFSESVMFDTPREQGILSLAIVGKKISQYKYLF